MPAPSSEVGAPLWATRRDARGEEDPRLRNWICTRRNARGEEDPRLCNALVGLDSLAKMPLLGQANEMLRGRGP